MTNRTKSTLSSTIIHSFFSRPQQNMKLPNNPLNTQTTKKTVSFTPKAHMKRTLHINDYSDREFVATWYTKEEMVNIRGDIKCTIELMAAGELCVMDKNTYYCTRGLECCSSQELRQQKLDNKMAASDAVLDEQDRQDKLGVVWCEEIARVYQAVSSHCQLAASLMGAADEKAVANSCVSSLRKHSISPITRRHYVQQYRAMY